MYTEKHHIIPKCIGGTNDKSNLTILTAREHFIVHYILAEKIYPENSKLWYAFVRMCNSVNKYQKRHIPSSTTYEYAKQRLSKTYKKYGAPSKGRVLSEEHKEIVRQANTGKTISKKMRSVLSEKYKGKTYEERFGVDRAEEIKLKISGSVNNCGDKNPMFGKKMKDISKNKMRITLENGGKKMRGNKNPNAKSVIHLETGIIFDTMVDAGRYFNVGAQIIRKRVKLGLFSYCL